MIVKCIWSDDECCSWEERDALENEAKQKSHSACLRQEQVPRITATLAASLDLSFLLPISSHRLSSLPVLPPRRTNTDLALRGS